MAERFLNLFVSFRYSSSYRSAADNDRRSFRERFAEELRMLAPASHLYALFPSRAEADILVWSAVEADDSAAPGNLFTGYARMVESFPELEPHLTLWGMTRPSMYARGKSEQDIDPFEGLRSTYLVVYPFTKTKEWYLMSMDARQGQMNEHIKLGKQYPDIKQLLLYSFGLQDQEFVVAYETEDLARFSELVQGLRSTEARRYTVSDVPILMGVYRTPEEFIG